MSVLPPPSIHRRALQQLERMLSRRRWASAYLVSGPAGCGLHQTADYLAKGILCASTPSPCGECLSCRKFDHENHPAFNRLPDFETVKEKVAQAREVISQLALRPYEGNRQVVVLPGADHFNPAAGNALLKTLEEPPGRAVLILLARRLTAVLPTIRSRCQVLRLPTPEGERLRARGELEGLSRSTAELQARIAAAQSGEAAVMSESEIEGQMAMCSAVWRILESGDGGDLVAWVEELVKGRDREAVNTRVRQWLAIFGLWLRDAMLLGWGCDPRRLTFTDLPEIDGVADPAPFERAAEQLVEAHRHLQANAQPRLVVGSLLLALQEDLARTSSSRYHDR